MSKVTTPEEFDVHLNAKHSLDELYCEFVEVSQILLEMKDQLATVTAD